MPKDNKIEIDISNSSNPVHKVKQVSQKGADTITKEAPKIAVAVAHKSKAAATKVAETTKKSAFIAKTKLQITKLKRQTDKNFRDLGRKVYVMSNANQTNVLEDEEVKQFIKKVVGLEKEATSLRKKLDNLD
jgi:hypothetical protein